MGAIVARDEFEGSVDPRPEGRRHGHALQGDHRLQPLRGPGSLGRLVERGEGLESQGVGAASGQVVVLSARGRRQHPHRVAHVEYEHLRVRVAAELRGEEAQEHRFAGAGGAEDERVADVRVMEVEPKRR